MLKILYTSHLEFRLKIRNISYDLPRKVFEQAKEHYYDTATKHYVAIHRLEFEGKIREMALTYDKGKDFVVIITIHPIKSYQKLSRINSRRRRKL